jgi:hypothetical protein
VRIPDRPLGGHRRAGALRRVGSGRRYSVAVRNGATHLLRGAVKNGVTAFPFAALRQRLRTLLGTGPVDAVPVADLGPPAFHADFADVTVGFAQRLQQHADSDLLIGFPPAPFILPLAASNRADFASYAARRPSHSVRLRRSGAGATAQWSVRPAIQPERYELTFTLPAGLEAWIVDDEDRSRRRTRSVKNTLLSRIAIYYEQAGELRVCHLRYEPEQLRAPATGIE